MIFICFVAFIATIVITAVLFTRIAANRFNKKVQAYSDSHVQKVIVNYIYNPKQQIEFTRERNHLIHTCQKT